MPTSSKLRLLTPAQRRWLFAVLALSVFLLGNSLYLTVAQRVAGIGERAEALPITFQVMLLSHVGLGLLATALGLIFALWHLKRALWRRTAGALSSGILLVAQVLILGGTGLLLVARTGEAAAGWVLPLHIVSAVLLPLSYAWHRLRSKSRPASRAWLRPTLVGVGIALLGAITTLAELPGIRKAAPPENPFERLQAELPVPPEWSDPPIADPFVPFRPAAAPDPSSPFFPAATTTSSGGLSSPDAIHAGDTGDPAAIRDEVAKKGFASNHSIGAGDCAECHPDVTKQWESSAHRFSSFNNPFYAKATLLTREAHGPIKSQWCAGCHDPALLLPGLMAQEALDVASPEAQTGLSCLSCHAVNAVHGQTGNGNWNLVDDQGSPYLFADGTSGLERSLHRYLIQAKPSAHKARLAHASIGTDEFCASCHKVSFDSFLNDYRWLRGQNEYDAWHDSGVAGNNPMTWYLPPTTKSCNDCHMPREAAPLGDMAAVGGTVKSHRFLGANTALPALRGDQEMLRLTENYLTDERMRVEIFALRGADERIVTDLGGRGAVVQPGESVQLDIVVRNRDVGHSFPGGTIDSNEAWLHVTVRQGEELIAESGALDDERHVDPSARFYRGVLVDKHGARIAKRNALDIHSAVYVNVVAPSTSDLARYRIELPTDLQPGSLQVEARLLWRKFNREYTEWTFEGREVPELPITTLAQDRVQLSVGPRAEAQNVRAPAAWTSFNDYGIASVLDGDTVTAQSAFETVARMEPERMDGWLNQARVALRDGNLTTAEPFLRQASEVAPDDPRLALWWGFWLERQGGDNLARALAAFERVRERFPKSRIALDRMATLHRRLEQPLRSAELALELLRIDPENAAAHNHRARAYRELARLTNDSTLAASWRYAAEQAERAHDHYRPDEDAGATSLEYRRQQPQDQRMAQPLNVHPLSLLP